MRKFGNFAIEALEKLFDENRLVVAVLVGIAEELTHRSSKRAADLAKRVTQAHAVLDKREPPEDEEPWSSYERSLTDAERALILRSPAFAEPEIYKGIPLWQQSREIARYSEHMLVPAITKSIDELGLALIHNADTYGLALRLAAFELRNEHVTRWPAFALLFRKMLGEKAVPWLPSLYLAAIGLEPNWRNDADFEDVVRFRNEFAQSV